MAYQKGHKGYWLGKRRPEQSALLSGKPLDYCRTVKAKKKMSSFRKTRVGEKAPNWRGGLANPNLSLRSSLEYKLWREAVYKRDNYSCVQCGDKRGHNLNADHIKPFAYFSELRFEVSNGRTLCVSCHKKTPTWGSKVFNYKLVNRETELLNTV